MTRQRLRLEVKDLPLLVSLVDAHDLTQRKLARIAGWTSHTYAGRLLRGQAKAVDPTPAARIARHFGVPVTDLFMRTPARNTGNTSQPEQVAA